MKYLIILAFFVLSGFFSHAQTNNATLEKNRAFTGAVSNKKSYNAFSGGTDDCGMH
ncbi:MAG: hypothetical protein M3Z56_00850 [Bacteroidota bacterium]|nr:hypothetical protein [Bacteroidota bacterium]